MVATLSWFRPGVCISTRPGAGLERKPRLRDPRSDEKTPAIRFELQRDGVDLCVVQVRWCTAKTSAAWLLETRVSIWCAADGV